MEPGSILPHTILNQLAENILVCDVTGIIAWEDLPAMGHD
jgi:hypothetical protein